MKHMRLGVAVVAFLLGSMVSHVNASASAPRIDVAVADASARYKGPVELLAQLTYRDQPGCFTSDNSCPATGVQVDVFLDGEYVGSAESDFGGVARIGLTSSPRWHVGEHQIRVETVSWVGVGVLRVIPASTTVIAHRAYIEAQLVDDAGTPIPGKAVRFGLGTGADERQICTAYTNASGTARCTPWAGAGISLYETGMLSYTASFDGTPDYNASLDSANLT